MTEIEHNMHRRYTERGATKRYIVTTRIYREFTSQTEAAKHLVTLTMKNSAIKKVFDEPLDDPHG